MSEAGQAFTPKEEVEIKAEMAVRDAWLAVTDVCNLHSDPLARPIIRRQEADLWSIKNKIDLLLTALEQKAVA